MLRQRKKKIEEVVQKMDAFTKVSEDYVEPSLTAAIIYLTTWVLAACLVWSEVRYFINPSHKFEFLPDTDFEAKLQINVDMTVAMPCDTIGADILDSTNQNTFSFGHLKEEPTWFELDRIQRHHFESIRTFNEYLREEYHAVQDLIWRSGLGALYGDLPERRFIPTEPHDACRIYGSLTLNKVAGNFHISAGKSVPLLSGHAHLTAFMDKRDYNFSHRIDKFSFGNQYGALVQPLEGDEKIAEKYYMNYQYFIQIVPTDVQTLSGVYSTYQYSVREQDREISHDLNSHGVPGIFFKYDMSPLKVTVRQDRESFAQFLVRLCAGVGGLVATSHILCGLVQLGIRGFCTLTKTPISVS